MKNGLHRKPTQVQRILKHLEEKGGLTQREMQTEYGIGQPSARIFELRQQGHEIITTMTDGVNRFGEPCRYAVYTLKQRSKKNEQEENNT